MDMVEWDGLTFEGNSIALFGAKLLVVKARRGMLGCGYLNVAAAEKLGHALAVVTGVSCYDDMLHAEVKQVSSEARNLGVVPGMTGAEALKTMN
ncbi:MAG: DUF1805 domain-containing protein [Lentisphaeria bacterium]|nr:DUF1805 domain-containing protein [Lentisphaeria bacterium]